MLHSGIPRCSDLSKLPVMGVENRQAYEFSPGIVIAHRISPGNGIAHRMSPGIVNAHRMSPGIVIAHSMSPGIAIAHKMSPGNVIAHRMSPGIVIARRNICKGFMEFVTEHSGPDPDRLRLNLTLAVISHTMVKSHSDSHRPDYG